MRRFVTRYAAAGAVACLVGGMLGAVASEAPAYAANTVTFKLSNVDIFDNGYNQSFTSVLTATESGGGIPGIPFIQSVAPGTGFTCGAPYTSTATTASCTIEAAPGPSNGDDSGVIGANGTSNSLVVADTDNTITTYTANEAMIIYPAPICGASGVNPFTGVAGTAGAQISPLDATYSSPLGSPTVAESCYDGASGPPSALLTNVSPSGGTIFMGSNATDAAGGTALTIMTGPGFNWTGGVGNGEADVDTGTAGLGRQVWNSATVTLVTVTGGSSSVSTTATSVPSTFPSTLGVAGITVSGTDIPTGTTVLSGAGTSTLTLSQNATGTPAGPETLTFTWASTASSPPSGMLTSASTVATEAAFKSSGDPANTCPPQQALIDAGLPFCLEEFEATGSGPSATQVALEYAGQNVPTSQAPTVALSSSSGSIGQSIDIADAAGACPEFVGAGTGNPVPASGLLSGTNNCWYARAGDPTPVNVTVDGNPATVTPDPTSSAVTNVAVTSGSAVATITASSVPSAFPTNLIGDLVTGAGIPAGTTVTSQGNGTTGNFATGEVTLSNDASTTSTGESLTFTNNADVSEGDYSVGASSTVTLVSVTGGSNTVSTTTSSAGSGDSGDSGFPASLAGDSVSGTDIPVGTQVVSVNATGSNSTSTLTLSNDATASPANETLTFYPAVLADPQLNAKFTIPDNTPAGPQTVDVCEATTPKNGNDWELGVQWMSPTGSLQYVSGNSGPTQICATSTIDVSLASSSTATTPASSGVVLGNSNTDSATVTGSVAGIDPTGSVAFYECGPTASPTPCTSGSWTQFDTESLSGTSNPDTVSSASFTPTSTGYWCFAGVYSGDSNYSGSSDSTTDECFDVTDTGSSTTTAPATSSIPFGDGNTDSATVTGDAAADPTGSVAFYECGPTTTPTPCTSGSWTQFDTESLSGTSNPDTVSSESFTPTSTGYWCFAGVYSGDSNYTGSSDSTTDECFEVSPGGSSTTTAPESSSIVLGAGNTDSATVTGDASADPTGSVAFYECGPTASPTPCTSGSWTQFDTESLSGTSNPDTVSSESFTPTSTGYWCFAGVYSGDSNYSGSSDTTTDECFDVTSGGSSTTTTPTSSSVVLGSSNTDSATVTGSVAGIDPTGSVAFYECGPTTTPTPCTSGSWTQFDTESLSGTSNPDTVSSESFTPTSTGYWCFAGVYSGDSNYTGSSDSTTDECFEVSPGGSSTTTAPESSSIVLGAGNTDSATVTGDASADPTGSVAFYECGPTASPTPCTSGSWTQFDTESLSGTSNPDTVSSESFTPTSTGYWCFAGVYSGDSNYSGSSDTTTDECFDVTMASAGTVTSPASSSIVLGGSNTDNAVVTGNAAGGSPTGTVTFYECGPTASPTPCTSEANQVGFPVGLTTGSGDTSGAGSASFTPTSNGYWCFAGVYSGDSNYSGSSDSTTDECFDVTMASSTTVSTPESSSVVLGGTDTDSVVVTGNAGGGAPTGTVTFYECGPSAGATSCTSQANQVGNPVGLTAGAGYTSSAGSVSFTPDSTGTWCFAAVYSGDSNYAGSSDTSTDECFGVTVASTSTTTTPTSSTGALGGPNSDVAVVTGNAAGGSPTGTVSFYECGPTSTPAPCSSLANPVGSAVGLTAGAGDTSSATSVNFTATSPGWWCFAGYYSSDTNYSASSDTSTDECFDVTSGSTSTTSTPTNSTIKLGQSDTDHATVTGNAAGGSPTGTVSFFECGPTSVATPCTSTANQVGAAINLTTGEDDTSTAASALFTPTSAGYWCYGAYYSGDSNYSSSSDTSIDECVHVVSVLTITTSSPLPDGTRLVRYRVKLHAIGGTGPYAWSLLSGSLPHGITLSSSGKLSGTPTVSGYFAFTIQVHDSSHPHERASKTFTLTLNG